MAMKILVTGGAGFIGSNFVHRTLATRPDTEIVVLDAMTYAANPGNLAGLERVELIVGDIADEKLVDDCVHGVDLVVHFAAESHNDNSLHDPLSFVKTNVVGTTVLARCCARRKVRLHHISTDEVFGDLPFASQERFTPQTPYQPSSPYSAAKASSDHMVRAFVRSLVLEATISNCSNNYGPRQHPEKFIPRQIITLLQGGDPIVYGTGANIRDWIHVDDHNDAVWAVIEKGKIGETYLIGADGEKTNLEIVSELAEIFNRPTCAIRYVQDRPGHDRRYAIDPSSVQQLGWSPVHTDINQGLKQTVQWYKSNQQWWQESYQESEARYRAHSQ